MPGDPSLVVSKRDKMRLKQRQAQIYALMGDKKEFDQFLNDFQQLADLYRQSVDPANKSNKALQDKLDKEMAPIKARMRKQYFYDTDELGNAFDQKHTIDEAFVVEFLLHYLKQDYKAYFDAKTKTEDAHRDSKRATTFERSNLPVFARVIHDELANLKPNPKNKEEYNFKWFQHVQEQLNERLKTDADTKDKNPEAYFAARAKSALTQDHKRFLVDVGQTNENSQLYQQELAAAKKGKNARVPATYGDNPSQTAAMVKVEEYAGRTGYPPAANKTNLIRAFDIGFSQDEVLAIFKSGKDTIEKPGHPAHGEPNPIEAIEFKLRGVDYKVSATLSPDGKKINYLKYPKGDTSRTTPLTGDDCAATLNNSLAYAHHAKESYTTVGEALDELAMHLAYASKKTDVYRSQNLKGYDNSDLDLESVAGAGLVGGAKPVAGAKLVKDEAKSRSGAELIKGGAKDESKSGATLTGNEEQTTLRSEHDEDEDANVDPNDLIVGGDDEPPTFRPRRK